MSYYSKVKLCLTKEDSDQFEQEIFNYDPKWWDTKEEKDGIICYSTEEIKWYSEYSEVSLTRRFLNYLYEDDKYFEFVRIGEDYEDIEARSNLPAGYDPCLFVRSYIDFM